MCVQRYLFYSAVSGTVSVHSDLWVASTLNILDPSAWVRHGPVRTDGLWSKSGALLLRPPPSTSYLYFGDSNNGRGMQLATTTNLINYTVDPAIWLPIRPLPYFDNQLVEGGPPPEPLSAGPILFIHNSAGLLRVNASTYSAYHVSFALLNASDPRQILFRAPVPVLSCEMGWEVGVEPWLRLTPYVVFTEGMRRYEEGGGGQLFVLLRRGGQRRRGGGGDGDVLWGGRGEEAGGGGANGCRGKGEEETGGDGEGVRGGTRNSYSGQTRLAACCRASQ